MSSAARDARPESFSHAAPAALANAQVRANIRHATGSIRLKRAAVVATEQPVEVLAHLRCTGAGGRHDGVEAVEDLDEAAGEVLRLARVARVRVHLSATGLLGRKHDLEPEPLEHGHGCLSDLREERVGEARDEEGDAIGHRVSLQPCGRKDASSSLDR